MFMDFLLFFIFSRIEQKNMENEMKKVLSVSQIEAKNTKM